MGGVKFPPRRVARAAKPRPVRGKALRCEGAVQSLGVEKQVAFAAEKACGQKASVGLGFLQCGGKRGKNGVGDVRTQNGMEGAAADGSIGKHGRQCAGIRLLLYFVIILYYREKK